MSWLSRGFFLERLSLVRADRLPIHVTFTDGWNSVAQGGDQSPTVCELLEYSLGGPRTRSIQSCKAIESVVLRIRDRQLDQRFEIGRGLAGACRLRTLGEKAPDRRERLMDVRGDALGEDSLSLFLLRLAGHEPFALRKNRLGETRPLAFGDIAFLSIVNQARMTGKTSIHLSEQYSRNTFEHAVLQWMMAGRLESARTGAARKASSQATRARLELLRELVHELDVKLEATSSSEAPAIADIVRADTLLAVRRSVWREEKQALLARADALTCATTDAPSDTEPPSARFTADFLHVLRQTIGDWGLPDATLALSVESRDLLIDGRPRGSLGPAERASIGAAFVVALMSHCARTGLPHPGFVVLESPRDGVLGDRLFRRPGPSEGQLILLEDAELPRAIADHVARTDIRREW